MGQLLLRGSFVDRLNGYNSQQRLQLSANMSGHCLAAALPKQAHGHGGELRAAAGSAQFTAASNTNI